MTRKPPTVAELRAHLAQHQARNDFAVAFNAFAECGNPALFWESLLRARKGGVTDFPAPFWRVLENVAADILSAKTDRQLWQAVGLHQSAADGPGALARAGWNYSNKRLGDALWLEHCRVTGEAITDPPDKLADGVVDTVRRTAPQMSKGAINQQWKRYKAAGKKP